MTDTQLAGFALAALWGGPWAIEATLWLLT